MSFPNANHPEASLPPFLPGTVILYAGNIHAKPEPITERGWMVCDGRTLLKKEYPALWEAIGETFGKLPNDALFRIPDFSGAPRPPKTNYLIQFK